eukprot:4803668-Amphidinium_carterae.2
MIKALGQRWEAALGESWLDVACDDLADELCKPWNEEEASCNRCEMSKCKCMVMVVCAVEGGEWRVWCRPNPRKADG